MRFVPQFNRWPSLGSPLRWGKGGVRWPQLYWSTPKSWITPRSQRAVAVYQARERASWISSSRLAAPFHAR